MDLIEWLETVKNAPREPLLESLREIHREKLRDPSWLPVAGVLTSLRRVQRPATDSHRAPSAQNALLPRAVDLLRRIEHGKRPASRVAPASASYDEVRELFRSREDELTRRASLTERVLDQIRRGMNVDRIPPPSPLQQELRIACPAGRASSGRFVVANETEAPREVHFEIGELGWAAGEPPALGFTPALFWIPPRETRVVQLRVDLSRCSAAIGEHLQLPVDVRAGDETLGRLWVELVIVGAAETETLR